MSKTHSMRDVSVYPPSLEFLSIELQYMQVYAKRYKWDIYYISDGLARTYESLRIIDKYYAEEGAHLASEFRAVGNQLANDYDALTTLSNDFRGK